VQGCHSLVTKVLVQWYIIWRVSTDRVRDEEIVLTGDTFIDIWKGVGTEALYISLRSIDDFHDEFQLEVYTTAGQSKPWPEFCVMSETCGDTVSDGSFNRALEWLNECTSAHDICNTSSGARQMPGRLVDITSGRPKLIETHGLVEIYVCLSHCWDDHQPLRTTTDTIQQHKIEIAWNDIPRTFQDAIQVTKRFHVDYIWIDSLCIIQDDLDDWAAQAA
jgi:hypothetical protein